MIQRLLLLAVLAFGIATTVSADIPIPDCLPCPPAGPGNNTGNLR